MGEPRLQSFLLAVFIAFCSGRPAGGGEIEGRSVTTPIGDLVIARVDTGYHFPPGCGDPGPLCHAVESGYKVLTVWLESEGDPSKTSDYLMDLEGIYVLSGDGNRTEQFAGGMTESGLFIAFTPPESDAGFVLHWAENPPIDLGPLVLRR